MDKTLLKGLRVLEYLAQSREPDNTLATLTSRLDLSRSNIHRTLQTLIYTGYVERNDDGTYKCTKKILALGARHLDGTDIKKILSPYKYKLLKQFGETIHLSILDGSEVIYIDKMDGIHPLIAYSRIGGRAPAYAVATGKALLATHENSYVDLCIPRLEPHTNRTHQTLESLKQELEQVRTQGFAINAGEWRSEIYGIAVSIRDGLGNVWGFGLSGPVYRFTPEKTKEITEELIVISKKISSQLGCEDD
ncbi:MAG: IclR family transcriptional regulator [Burkholderiaceae bacterium]|nr:IclR family transcriptional regulator [Burkholderiaceae bacterium]